ncbi:MAG: ATP-binding protein [Syntrophobacteraceae bacterium]
MRLRIFWRVIFAQSALIVIILILSFYSLGVLNDLRELDSGILTLDSSCVEEEKQLQKVFLIEMRNAEKYILSRESSFQEGYLKAKSDFSASIDRICSLVDTTRERELAEEIINLHERYDKELNSALSDRGPWELARREIGDGIIDRGNELIRLREQIISDKMTQARDKAAEAAQIMKWLTLAGTIGAILLAFVHARGVSRPLRKLAEEMDRVGKGEFTRTVVTQGPKEVDELTQTFNRMTDELVELDRLKADFTAHVSHELRTPLAAIREGAALLLEEIPGPLTVPQHEILDVVRNHTERLFRSISSILDLSKMEAQMMEYAFIPCDLAAVIRRSINTVELIARKEDVRIRVNLSTTLPILILDEARIQQVLDNLLNNALKFTPEGGEIRISTSLETNDSGQTTHVRVRVSDSGEGIREEELERVFTRFYQGQRQHAKKQQGTGLGLAIARHVVEAHRGKIWAESNEGQGASFIFSLPISSHIIES